MKKRGQITIFLIIGLIILVFFGIFYYAKSYNAKSAMENAPEKTSSSSDIVKAYAESCIKDIAENALFEIVSEQGGYIDVAAATRYGEDGIVNSQISPAYAQFQGKNVPYYLEAECDKYCSNWECTCSPAGCQPPPYPNCPPADYVCTKEKCRKWTYKENIPRIDEIEKKLANYIAVEFEDCFNANVFSDIGLKVEKPIANYRAVNFDFSKTKVNINVSANAEDTTVMLKYPIIVTKGGTETKLDSFIVVLPIRLKALHDSSIELINNMKAKLSNDIETDFLTDTPYPLSAIDCASFDKNGFTNVYVKTSDSGKKEVVQFVDFSTYQQYYFNSYIFQFAVKNIDVQGNCVG